MKKKKVLALVLAAAMTAGVLSGCGNSDGENRGGAAVNLSRLPHPRRAVRNLQKKKVRRRKALTERG
nr:hypothetical protein [uncultured Acetatifactor sp.]